MIDADEIAARLKAVQELLEAMEQAAEPDVEAAAEVARMMAILADDLRNAVMSAGDPRFTGLAERTLRTEAGHVEDDGHD